MMKIKIKNMPPQEIKLTSGKYIVINGPEGPAGPQGETGPAGPRGETGPAGPQGERGKAGYTPVKGVDYFTPSDIDEMESVIENNIKEITGELANLDTTDKSNLVSAINEIASSGGTEGADIFRVTNRNIDLLGLKKGTYILDPNYINVFTANIYYSPLRSGSDSWQVDLSDGRFYVLTDITDNMENGVPVVSYYMQDSSGAQKNIMMTIDSTSSGYAGLKTKDVAKSYQIITTNAVQSIYAKKTFTVLPESSVVPTTDNQLTNKKYVDDAVAGAGGGSAESLVYWLETDNKVMSDWDRTTDFTNNDLIKLSEIVKKAYDNGQNFFNIIVTSANGWKTPLTFNYGRQRQGLQGKPTSIIMFSIASDNQITNTLSYQIYSSALSMNIRWNDNVPTVTGGYIYTLKSIPLMYNNTQAYTVSSNYQPAHKKYVDDAIASIKAIVYSTTETVIGTFLGKPLYQKMITFDNIVSSTPITVPHNISNLDVISSIEGVMYNTNNTFGNGRICYPIPFNTAPSESSGVGVRVCDNNIEISSSSGSWSTDWQKIITLKYTKTTD